MYTTTDVENSFEECYDQCTVTTYCQGFTWAGPAGYDNGVGRCFFKGTGVPGTGITFTGSGNPELVACIKVDQSFVPPVDTTTTTSTSSELTSSVSSSSSAENPYLPNPPNYATTTTTTSEPVSTDM